MRGDRWLLRAGWGLAVGLGLYVAACRANPRAALVVTQQAELHHTLGAHIAFAPDGRYFTSGSAWNIVEWRDDKPGKQHDVLVGDSLAVAAQGGKLLTPQGIFDLGSGVMQPLVPPLDIGYEQADAAIARDLRHAAIVAQFRPPPTRPEHLPNGQTRYHSSLPMHPNGAASFLLVIDPRTGKELHRMLPNDARFASLSGVVLTKRYLIVLDTESSKVRIFSRDTWKEVRSLQAEPAPANNRLVVSEDETRVAVFGGTSSMEPDPGSGRVLVWDLGSFALLARFQPHPMQVQSLAFSSGGRYLATGDDGGHLDIWQLGGVETPQHLWGTKFEKRSEPLRGRPFSDRVTGLAFSPSGDRLVVGLDLDGEDVVLFKISGPNPM